MKAISFNPIAIPSFVVIVTLLACGCGQRASEPAAATNPSGVTSNDNAKHGGWWCVEHGIPEEVCSMCSAKAADDCKAKGDWCEEHNRADSQCFICHPERAEKFAKLYEAKIGHAPPAPVSE